jgi:membrane-associated phospholipid phosphatase
MAVDEGTVLQRLPNPRWLAMIPVSLGLAVGCLLLFAWLAEVVLSESVVRSDENIRAFIHQFASPTLTRGMRFVTNFGDWQIVLFGTVILLLILLYFRAFNYMKIVAVTMTGGGILDGVLKDTFRRTRPEAFFIPRPTTYSFPSGHALISLCFYGLLAGIISLQWRKQWQRVLTWALAVLAIGTIGFSRIYLGVHWPSDVLAGYLSALMWMGAVRFVAVKLDERRAAPAATSPPNEVPTPEDPTPLEKS